MAINYDEISDATKLIVADILSKRESIESELADIQTERALAQVAWDLREQELKAEVNKLTQEVRNVRKATVSGAK
jgi:VIT1/CCC1 family predicted Fe2+/Mn2+ transporter